MKKFIAKNETFLNGSLIKKGTILEFDDSFENNHFTAVDVEATPQMSGVVDSHLTNECSIPDKETINEAESEEDLRAAAKQMGITSFHLKSIERLKKEMEDYKKLKQSSQKS